MRDVAGCEVLVVGGGITGLTVARELLRHGVREIIVLEKEPVLGVHASGRNSGVLHAGIYYTPDSLKARFCIEGNRLMKAFCREKSLTLHELGKVIVTKSPGELDALHELKRRADAAGAATEIVDETRLGEIEPYAATCEQALYSPETAVIRPKEVLQALANELEESGQVELWRGTSFRELAGDRMARTSRGNVRFDRLVNAAGAYADRVAHEFGLAREYKILPFKGTYKKLAKERAGLVRGNIYPVPNLQNPFLGVHFTRSANGEVHVGPTAIPALGRENYRLLEGLNGETVDILLREAVLFLRNSGFRSAALTEPRRYFKRYVWAEARGLVPSLRLEDLEDASKVGIRPQLVHWPCRQLVNDFVVIRGDRSLHVLNANSPAFTSSMAFARHLVTQLLEPEGVLTHAISI